jgi:hypothetical protein
MKTLLSNEANKDIDLFYELFERSKKYTEQLEKELEMLHNDAEKFQYMPGAIAIISERLGKLRAFIGAMLTVDFNIKGTHSPNCECFGETKNLEVVN